jgi:NADH dehydrogenase FAD-containing subunit
MSREPLNVVILGASFAGLSAAHNFLSKTIDELGTTRTAPRYRVVLVSPSTHLYWNIGAPRAIVSSSLVPHSKSFVPIEEAFRSYPKNRFTFIQGSAIAVDFNQKNVTISVIGNISTPILDTDAHWSSGTTNGRACSEPKRQTSHHIPYHALILASGTSTDSPLLSLHGPHEKTITALDNFHSRVRDATSIIIVGGGPSGVECAGQLATYINGGKGPKRSRHTPLSPASATFSTPEKKKHNLLYVLGAGRKSRPGSTGANTTASQPNNKKVIILLSGNKHLLPHLPPSMGGKAEKKLKKMGVNIIHHLRLLSAQELPSGSTRCILSDDLTMQCDLFIAATGVHPNTQYLPAELLDASGYINADPYYLRVSRAGERVYTIGDCASFSKNTIMDVYDSVPVLMKNMKNDLLAYELKTHYPFGGAEAELEELQDLRYEQDPRTTQILPITRFGGVGVAFGYFIPSFLVYLLKGNNYRFNKAKLAVRAGHNPYARNIYVYK